MPTERKKKTYMPRTNAVCVTVYHPTGDIIPPDVTAQCLDAIQAIVSENRLLTSVATS